MGNSQSEALLKGLNSQQMLASQNLKSQNENLTKELQDSKEARDILQAKIGELSDENVGFCTQLFAAETKLRVLTKFSIQYSFIHIFTLIEAVTI